MLVKKSDKLKIQFENYSYKLHKTTEPVFRTLQKIIDLLAIILNFNNYLNGINIGIALVFPPHFSYCEKKIVNNIIETEPKLSVLTDESTTSSTKSAMIVYIKATVCGKGPIFIFSDLVELNNQTAENIVNRFIDCLHKCGFSETFLKIYWISFLSYGASVLVGKRAGVAKKLKDKYPCNFNWHCLNHRLE